MKTVLEQDKIQIEKNIDLLLKLNKEYIRCFEHNITMNCSTIASECDDCILFHELAQYKQDYTNIDKYKISICVYILFKKTLNKLILEEIKKC